MLYAGLSCKYQKTPKCNMQDYPAYNHLGYMQDRNLMNPKPNHNPNLNLVSLTVTLGTYLDSY